MAAQIPGLTTSTSQPDIFTRVRTRERVNAVSGGGRLVCIIGEGEAEEDLVISARGGGLDGFNPDFSGTNAPDGRHYRISTLNLVPGRTRIFKNRIPILVVEGPISINPFDSRYDARVDPLTGRVELQPAHLEDYGTDDLANVLFYERRLGNVGTGKPNVTSDSLTDKDAPQETWSIRCVSNIKDGSGNTVSGEAVFTVTGSFSGQVKDANGNPIVWRSNATEVSNGILSFSISEGGTPFEVGDRFTMKVNSGVLNPGDSLSARYIAEVDLNDPETFFSPTDCFTKHGNPSATNTLSLGVQMAFENGAPRVTAIQAKPPVPRKTIDYLINQDNLLTDAVEGATGDFELPDTIFPLSANPDVDSNVNVFVVSADGSEEQVLLNKEAFYTYSSPALAYANFVLGPTGSAYTVFQAGQVEQQGEDGYVESTSTTEIFFSAPLATFEAHRLKEGESDVGKNIVILSPPTLVGTYEITTIGDGYGNMTQVTATIDTGTIPGGSGLVVDGTVKFQIVDPNELSSYLAITDDVAVNYLTVGKGLRVSYVNTVDIGFYDTNWGEALEACEEVEVQIVVPLPNSTVSNIFQATKVHVESMSNIINARERIAIFGAITGLSPENLLGRKLAAVEDIGVLEGIQGDSPEDVLAGNIEDLADYSVATSFGDSFRTVYMWPDQIVRNIAGQNTFLPGYYMAPALGGFLGGQTNIAEPATFKTLAGFNILRDRVARKITKNELAGAGVLVVEPIAGGGRMLHGLTTVQSRAPEEEEISIVAIRDYVARTVRATLRPFVGRVDSPTLIPALSQGIAKLMRSMVGQGILSGFGKVQVARNAVEPRQVDIGIIINPVGPINWIFVDLEISL